MEGAKASETAGASITKYLGENLREGALLRESELLSMGGVGPIGQSYENNLIFFNSNSFLNNQSINNDNYNNISNNFNDAYDNDKSDVNGDGKSCLGIDNEGCNLLKNNDQRKDFDIM